MLFKIQLFTLHPTNMEGENAILLHLEVFVCKNISNINITISFQVIR